MRERTRQVVASWASVCSAEIAVTVVGGAWKPSILSQLHTHGVLRFGQLSKVLGDPTARVLTRQLRELEDDGLVTRTVYAEVPPKVEYALSEMGRDVQPVIDRLARWGAAYAQRCGDHLDPSPSPEVRGPGAVPDGGE